MTTNNAINASDPIGVPSGGTGVASPRAYGVLFGGSSNTGPLQSVASLGTAGQVLTDNGFGFYPTFQDPTLGLVGFVYISSLTASNSATLDFAGTLNTGIPSTIPNNFLVIFDNIIPVNNNVTFYMLVGTGGGPTYSVLTYSGQCCVFNDSVSAPSDNSLLGTQYGITYASDLQSGGLSGYMYIFTANDAVNYKNFSSNVSYASNNNSGGMGNALCSGSWSTATQITSLRFAMSLGNISGGSIQVHGAYRS